MVLFSCLVEKNLHLASSDSRTEPLCFLASGDGPGCAHTVRNLLLHRLSKCPSGVEVGKAGLTGLSVCSTSSPWSRRALASQVFQDLGFAFSKSHQQQSSPPSSRGCGAESEKLFGCSSPQRSLLLWGFPDSREPPYC